MKQGERIITKKEDKITRSLLFLLFVIFISILLRWVIFNSVTVTVPHLFFIIATPFCLFFFFGYSNFAHLRDVHMVWKCNTNLSEKWKIHPQPPKFQQNFFFHVDSRLSVITERGDSLRHFFSSFIFFCLTQNSMIWLKHTSPKPKIPFHVLGLEIKIVKSGLNHLDLDSTNFFLQDCIKTSLDSHSWLLLLTKPLLSLTQKMSSIYRQGLVSLPNSHLWKLTVTFFC